MKIFKRIALTIFLVSLSSLAWAGGGYIINDDGDPLLWDTNTAIEIHPESGSCGGFTNAQMLAKIEANLEVWSGQADVNLAFEIVDGEIGTVDGDNYGDFLSNTVSGGSAEAAGDGINPILFDDDGEIIASVAGNANRLRVLGFANPSGFSDDLTEIIDGQAVFNCRCLEDNPNGACASGIEFSEDELDFTMVHEMGHFLNLDHAQVNSSFADDGNDANDTNLPTMYPVSENAGLQISPISDDINALGSLYPSDNFLADHCRVTGTLLNADGEELRCADVQAIPTDRTKAVAFVSGAYAEAVDLNEDSDTADDGECRSGCGDFVLFLDPDTEYEIRVEPINSAFVGGSGISPCANSQVDDCDDAGADESNCIGSESITTITADDCTGGVTINLGDIETTSSAATTPGTTTTVSSSGCSLQTSGVTNLSLIFWSLSPLMILLRGKKQNRAA